MFYEYNIKMKNVQKNFFKLCYFIILKSAEEHDLNAYYITPEYGSKTDFLDNQHANMHISAYDRK